MALESLIGPDLIFPEIQGSDRPRCCATSPTGRRPGAGARRRHPVSASCGSASSSAPPGSAPGWRSRTASSKGVEQAILASAWCAGGRLRSRRRQPVRLLFLARLAQRLAGRASPGAGGDLALGQGRPPRRAGARATDRQAIYELFQRRSEGDRRRRAGRRCRTPRAGRRGARAAGRGAVGAGPQGAVRRGPPRQPDPPPAGAETGPRLRRLLRLHQAGPGADHRRKRDRVSEDAAPRGAPPPLRRHHRAAGAGVRHHQGDRAAPRLSPALPGPRGAGALVDARCPRR